MFIQTLARNPQISLAFGDLGGQDQRVPGISLVGYQSLIDRVASSRATSNG